jgi:hypothetical protein
MKRYDHFTGNWGSGEAMTSSKKCVTVQKHKGPVQNVSCTLASAPNHERHHLSLESSCKYSE